MHKIPMELLRRGSRNRTAHQHIPGGISRGVRLKNIFLFLVNFLIHIDKMMIYKNLYSPLSMDISIIQLPGLIKATYSTFDPANIVPQIRIQAHIGTHFGKNVPASDTKF